MRLSPRLLIACAAIALSLPLADASAKAPPTGRYDCTIGGTLFGTLTIKARGAYTHRGSRGTFTARGGQVTFPDKIKGWRISFRRGTLGGMKGRWYKAKDGTPQGTYEIALKNPRNGVESIYGGRRKSG